MKKVIYIDETTETRKKVIRPLGTRSDSVFDREVENFLCHYLILKYSHTES